MTPLVRGTLFVLARSDQVRRYRHTAAAEEEEAIEEEANDDDADDADDVFVEGTAAAACEGEGAPDLRRGAGAAPAEAAARTAERMEGRRAKESERERAREVEKETRKMS